MGKSIAEQVADQLQTRCPVTIINVHDSNSGIRINFAKSRANGRCWLEVTTTKGNALITTIPIQLIVNHFTQRQTPQSLYDDTNNRLPFTVHQEHAKKEFVLRFTPDEGWEIQSSDLRDTQQSA